MLTRRQFMGWMAAPAVAAGAVRFSAAAPEVADELRQHRARHPDPEALARDETYWAQAQRAFVVDRSIVNLNNGGVSPSPLAVQEAMRRYLDYSNLAPPYTMWRILEPQKEGVRRGLARLFGADPEEIAITRNASEGLHICQLGFDIRPGDELLTTDQDYPRMVQAWLQRQRREGAVLRRFPIPVPMDDPQEIVRRFEAHVTPRTRAILVSHVVNLTGQLLPVPDVVRLGRRRGIPVIVDGAHSFAHFPFRRADLGCDYFATSLHKWLFAPHGTGMLYVRREKIRDLWALMPPPEGMDDDIRKFEEIGTHPAANALAVAEALAFHESLGAEAKAARLRLLRDTWVEQLRDLPGFRLLTNTKPGLACGIATFALEGVDAADLVGRLWRDYRVLTTAIAHPDVRGIRVSPSVYTSLGQLDVFCEAVRRIAASRSAG